MFMLAELVDAVVGGDAHRDAHTLVMLTPVGAAIATVTIDMTTPVSLRLWRGSLSTLPARESWSDWKAPAVMASGWPER